jgi:ABC-type branched-subunit amino acid transport system ATPase component
VSSDRIRKREGSSGYNTGDPPLLTVDDVDFSYGTVQVLFGVSLLVDRGEMLALLGTNGAGKSTLLRVVCGLARPSAGHVILDDEDVTGSDVVAMVSRGVVLVPGGKAVFGDMSVDENLLVGAHMLRRDAALARQRRDEALTLFPRLVERLDTAAGALSGGEQQQLALAKAFLLQPKLLLIDELSLGLAPGVVQTLLEAVRAINRGGSTVVVVEQSLNVAASLTTRAVFMEKGEVRFEGRTSELLERSDIARAVFLGGHASEELAGARG